MEYKITHKEKVSLSAASLLSDHSGKKNYTVKRDIHFTKIRPRRIMDCCAYTTAVWCEGPCWRFISSQKKKGGCGRIRDIFSYSSCILFENTALMSQTIQLNHQRCIQRHRVCSTRLLSPLTLSNLAQLKGKKAHIALYVWPDMFKIRESCLWTSSSPHLSKDIPFILFIAKFDI